MELKQLEFFRIVMTVEPLLRLDFNKLSILAEMTYFIGTLILPTQNVAYNLQNECRFLDYLSMTHEFM